MRALSLTRGTIAETPYNAEDMALDAALKAADDPYATRRALYVWTSDPYAAQLAEDEDYSHVEEDAEREGAL